MGDDCHRYFQRKTQIFELPPASGAAYVANAANLAAGRRKQPRSFYLNKER